MNLSERVISLAGQVNEYLTSSQALPHLEFALDKLDSMDWEDDGYSEAMDWVQRYAYSVDGFADAMEKVFKRKKLNPNEMEMLQDLKVMDKRGKPTKLVDKLRFME